MFPVQVQFREDSFQEILYALPLFLSKTIYEPNIEIVHQI